MNFEFSEIRGKVYFFLLIIYVGFCLCGFSLIQEKKNVLVLQSYHRGLRYTDDVTKGINSILEPEKISAYVQYMDTKRNPSREFTEILRDYYVKKYTNVEFDGIIVVDDNAMRFMIEYGTDIFSYRYLVFCGVNDPENYNLSLLGEAYGNITDFYVKENIRNILEVIPETQKIVFVNENVTDVGMLIEKEINENIKDEEFRNIQFEIVSDFTMDELLRYVSMFKNGTTVFMLSYVIDGKGGYYSYDLLAKLIPEKASVPVFVPWDFYMGSGALGGFVTSGFNQGKAAAEQLIGLFEEGKAHMGSNEGYYIFDVEIADKFIIPIESLPKGSELINWSPNFYVKYKAYIDYSFLIFIFMAAATVWLRIYIAGKKRYSMQVERQKSKMIEIEEKLNKSVDFSKNLGSCIRKAADNLKSLIDLVSEFGKEVGNPEKFYNKLLQTALKVVEEADYGSISMAQGDEWKFITTVGHDVDKLRALPLKKSYMAITEDITIYDIDGLVKINRQVIPPEVFEEFAKATKKIKETMIYTLKIDRGNVFDIAIDIDMNSDKSFSEKSKETFEAFTNLVKVYLRSIKEYDDIKKIYMDFSNSLAIIAEAHDDLTGVHIFRVGELSALIAEKLGLDEALVDEIRTYAPLHDIGKIFVSQETLNKPGKLSGEEWNEIKTHTVKGAELLDDPYFETARKIALYHHEKCDGSGYPFGLKADEIPIEAKIVSVVDVYEALRSERSYKPAYSHEKTMGIILCGDSRTSRNHFDERILAVFEKHQSEIRDLFDKIKS